MPKEQSGEKEAIEVEFTATLRYEPWEVEEFDITEQAAVENLCAHISREPSNAGEFKIKQNGESSDDPSSRVNLD